MKTTPLNSSDDDAPAWYCVRTKTKRENIASKTLSQLEEVHTFCPRLKYKKATRRGKIWWVEAMFPGYIFVHFRRKEMERAIVHTTGVIKLLRFGDKVPPISPSLIKDLRKHIQNTASEEADLLTLQPLVQCGDEVEIAHGAMKGLAGQVVEMLPASERVKVLIDFLGQPQIVDTDLFTLLLPSKPIPNIQD